MNPQLDVALDTLFVGAAAFVGALLSASPQWTALMCRLERIQTLQEEIMATVAELKTDLDTLTGVVTDYTADVSAKLSELQGQMTRMQNTIDTAGSQHAADQATIDALTEQLGAMSSGLDEAVARTRALTDAITAADQPVDRG